MNVAPWGYYSLRVMVMGYQLFLIGYGLRIMRYGL